jgi:hypothetical protein
VVSDVRHDSRQTGPYPAEGCDHHPETEDKICLARMVIKYGNGREKRLKRYDSREDENRHRRNENLHSG